MRSAKIMHNVRMPNDDDDIYICIFGANKLQNRLMYRLKNIVLKICVKSFASWPSLTASE